MTRDVTVTEATPIQNLTHHRTALAKRRYEESSPKWVVPPALLPAPFEYWRKRSPSDGVEKMKKNKNRRKHTEDIKKIAPVGNGEKDALCVAHDGAPITDADV